MTHIAFDLGLKTTGVAWDGGSDHFICPAALHRSPMTPEREHERYAWWRTTFAMILMPHRGADVIVEAPFMHSVNRKGSVGLIMLHGILRAVAIDGGHQVHEVENQTLKKWATTKAKATKDEMLEQANVRRRISSLVPYEALTNADEADAWLLYRMWCEVVAA